MAIRLLPPASPLPALSFPWANRLRPATRRTRQVIEERCRSLRSNQQPQALFETFSEEYYALSNMIADAAREDTIAPGFERDYQLRRMSYLSAYQRAKTYLPAAHEAFETLASAATLEEAVAWSFWEHLERMECTGAALAEWEMELLAH